eukprot:9844131-Ditylum_brightwellii.AAC.1
MEQRMGLDYCPSKVQCTNCNEIKQNAGFSKSQLRKTNRAQCKCCVEQISSSSEQQKQRNNNNDTKEQTRRSFKKVTIHPRPQNEIPGFEGLLSCCSDWSKTKHKRIPSAQSAIFTPLFAMIVGPIEGCNTAEELKFASQWWTEVFPAWPCWVEQLKQSGLTERCEELIRMAKGQPTSLIPRARGYGTVPHFQGRMQTEAIESSPDEAVELFACISYMYSSDKNIMIIVGNGQHLHMEKSSYSVIILC